jgi:TPR repeat protein
MFYYVIIIAGNEPQVDAEAISGLASAIGSAINVLKPQGKVRVAIVAMDQFEVSYDLDDWQAGELTFKNKLALEIVKERAADGDKQAQWFLYEVQPNHESMLWLCHEADQGDVKARSELGKLYFYGSDAYRETMNVHIPVNLSRACAWFHLAGQAEITENPEIEEVQAKQTLFESAEVERTANIMTPEEIEEAEKLVMTWESGQCSRDISQNMMQWHAEDTALERLCTAADLGDFSSREELGRIYFHGSRGVKRNLVQAYKWYRLAEKVYEPPSMHGRIMQKNCDAMSAEQHASAVKFIEEWGPGKCEQDLLLYDR